MILLPISLFCLQARAAGLLDDSVAPQAMQTVNSQNLPVPKNQQQVSSPDSNTQQKSAAIQGSRDQSTQAQSAVTKPAVTSPRKPAQDIILSPKTVMTMQLSRELEDQLSTLNAQVAQYQKQNDSHFSTLQGQVLVLQSRLTSMSKAVTILHQNQVLLQNRLNPVDAATISGASVSIWQRLTQHMAHYYLIYIMVIILLLLIVFYFFVPRQSVDASGKQVQSSQEYDFLGSPEGVSAKLDLARAYFAMQDFVQMRAILQEVLKIGDTEQRRVAQSLMDDIPAEST